jgi:hypothetical protein
MQQITVGTSTYTLVSMPSSPAPADISFGYSDTVATVPNPFTRQMQTYTWPGGDLITVTVTLPPMTTAQSFAWEAFLAELRGQANIFQLGDPRVSGPQGTVNGSPLTTLASAAGGTGNVAMSTTLGVQGFADGDSLAAGDYVQAGYRLYRVLESTGPITGGQAALTIYPSIRATHGDGTAVVVRNCKGVFRLAGNARQFQSSPGRLTTMSFQAVEVR